MSSNRILGVHLRLNTSYSDLAQQALSLGLNSFQLFLTPQNQKNYLKIMAEDELQLIKLRPNFNTIYVHSSYWINLATGKEESAKIAQRLLSKELRIAERLALTHLVLHPGSAQGHIKTTDDPTGKKAGMQALATTLNTIHKKHPTIKILLENTAHAGFSIGSDFNDLAKLKQLLTHPEQIKFCLDFAHAYAYGYDVTQTESFITTLNESIGIDSIELLHLNDSLEPLTSKKDHHEIPGKGLIGMQALKALAMHPKLVHIPIILELPPLKNPEIQTIINEIKDW